ncbi:MAG: DUF993 family protein [Pirellula sp.]
MKITFPDGAYKLRAEPLAIRKPRTAFNRVAFAAAHVVADSLSGADPSGPPALEWERTLAYRRHLLDLGFGIAEGP